MRSLRLRKIIISIVLSCAILGTVGCTQGTTNGKENSNIVVGNLNKEDSSNSTENDDIENGNLEQVGSVDDNIEEETEKESDIKSIEMLLYSKDANTEEEVTIGKVDINEDLSLEEKLKALASNLSEKAFNNLPINLVKVNDVNGKKIALFNLDEIGENAKDITFDKYTGVNWVNNYFAGSTGGSITEYTLIKTLLQSNYSGEWIDGLEFTYKNSKIEFDHIPELMEIVYR